MKLIDFFDNPIFEFPGNSDRDFTGMVKKDFEIFHQLLKQVDDEYGEIITEIKSQLDQTCKELILVLDAFYLGNMIDAYNILKVTMQRLESDLVFNKFPGDPIIDDAHFYRARIVDKDPIMKPSDMFHMPFHDRQYIKTTRFSIPGLPCLYLSSSIYTCWEELDQHDLRDLAVSRFRTTQKLNYLNLVPDYEWFREILHLVKDRPDHQFGHSFKHTMKSWLPRTLKVFPLLYLCYRQVRYRDAVFKPEYIFPQLLMQWLLHKPEYHGIRYMSTKCEVSGDNHNAFINYALPVRSTKSEGFCDILSSQFNATAPVRFNTTKSNRDINGEYAHDIDVTFTSIITTYKLRGETHNYHDSDFKEFELQMARLPYHPLSTVAKPI